MSYDVISRSQGYIWDVGTLMWIKDTGSGGGGGGGGGTVDQGAAGADPWLVDMPGVATEATLSTLLAQIQIGTMSVSSPASAGVNQIATEDTLLALNNNLISSPLVQLTNNGSDVAAIQTTAPTGTEYAVVTRNIPSGTQPVSGAVSFTAPQHVVVDSGSTTTVTGNVTVVQPTGTNLHTVVDSGSITVGNAAGASAVNIQDGGNSLTVDGAISFTAPQHVIADSGTITTITNVVHVDDNAGSLTVDSPNLDVALSTRLKPADTLTAVTTVGTITNVVHVDDNAGSLTIDNANLDVALSTRLKPADTLTAVTTVGTITNVVHVDDNAGSLTIDATSLPLPTLASTSTKQSDGSQKTQVVDGSGNVIGSHSNSLDVAIHGSAGETLATTSSALNTFITNSSITVGKVGPSTVTGTLTGVGQSVSTNNTVFQTSAGIIGEVSGTWTGTITFRSNATGLGYTDVMGVSALTGTCSTTTTANGKFYLPSSQQIQCNATSWSSGTANVTFYTTDGVSGEMVGSPVLDAISSKLTSPLHVDDNAGSLTVDGTVTVTAPTAVLVQQATANYSLVNNVVVNLGAAPRPGSALVLCVANGNIATTGVSGGGVSWVQAVAGSTHLATSIWYGLNSSGVGTAITVTFGDASGDGGANVSEYSGVVTANAVDGAPTATSGLSTSVTTPTVTTITSHTLLVAAAGVGSSTATSAGPTNSFTGLTEASSANNKIVPAYRIVSSTGSYNTNWTEPLAGWDAAIIALKTVSIGTVDQGTPATTSDATAWPVKIVYANAQVNPASVQMAFESPAYTSNNTTQPLSLDQSGNLRVINDNTPVVWGDVDRRTSSAPWSYDNSSSQFDVGNTTLDAHMWEN